MKKTYYTIAGIVVLIVGYISWSLLFGNSYKITVVSDPNATISVATTRAATFEEIGVGQVTYKTSQGEPLYFRAALDDSLSYATVEPNNNQDQAITIPLSPPVSSTEKFNQPISSYIWVNKEIYGVDKLSNSIINTAENKYVLPEISFISVPYVDSVIWKNNKNFVYNEFAEGSGAVINGKNQGSIYFESKFDNPSGSEKVETVQMAIGSPMAVLSSKSIYISNDFGQSLKKITDITPYENPYFKSTKDFIIYANQPVATEYASETEKDFDSSPDELPSTGLYVYDYQGNQVLYAEIPNTHTLKDVVWSPENNLFYVVSDHKLFTIDTSGAIKTATSLHLDPENIVILDDKLYMFTAAGLWTLDNSSNTFSLLTSFGASAYVPGSLVIDSSELTFTVIDKTQYSGSIRSVSLK